MDIVRRSHRTDISGFADSPIGPYVDTFKLYLTERRQDRRHRATDSLMRFLHTR